MGVLIDTLTAKYSAQNPPLSVSAGILQETMLDAESNLAFADVGEAQAHIMERLVAREGEALMVENQGRFPFPVPDNLKPAAFPNRDSIQIAAQVDYQLQTAAEAVEKFVLGDLFLKASQRNPELYMAKAMFYLGDKTSGRKGEAELTLQRVLDSVLAMADDFTPKAHKSNVLRSAQPGHGTNTTSEYGESACRRSDVSAYGYDIDYRDFAPGPQTREY